MLETLLDHPEWLIVHLASDHYYFIHKLKNQITVVPVSFLLNINVRIKKYQTINVLVFLKPKEQIQFQKFMVKKIQDSKIRTKLFRK